jgi:hypothetical protein
LAEGIITTARELFTLAVLVVFFVWIVWELKRASRG